MAAMRGPRPLRSIRQAIEDRNAPVSRTEVLEDNPHRLAVEQMLPQIAAESEQASKVTRQVFSYYRRKRSGRRCSCFEIEAAPSASCQICYGSGFVGGWDLNGCRSEWIDVTYPNLVMVNVTPGYFLGARPTPFVLEPGVNEGFIETDLPVIRNSRIVQATQLGVGKQTAGTSVKAFVKAPGDVAFVPLTDEALSARLGNSMLRLRLEMHRDNTQIESPWLSHLMLRYKLIPETEIYGDVNLAESSFELGDMGLVQSFSTMTVFFPKSVDHIETEDFMIRQSDQKRFKVSRFERNCVAGVLLSHKVYARLLIPGTDQLVTFP